MHASNDFNFYFKDNCVKSLYVKPETVRAIQEIQGFCEDVQKHTFFQRKFDNKQRLEEFKNAQDLHIQCNTFSQLKLNFPNQIFASIQKHFGSITSGQFKICDRIEEFENSKLKKFLNVVKVMMQDSIYSLTKKSYFEFVEFIKSKVPTQVLILIKTVIHGVDKVTNIFVDGSTQADPIFFIDILKSLQSNEFIYSSNPQYYATTIMQIFDKAATDIQKFPNLESKVINELIKNSDSTEKFLKVKQ